MKTLKPFLKIIVPIVLVLAILLFFFLPKSQTDNSAPKTSHKQIVVTRAPEKDATSNSSSVTSSSVTSLNSKSSTSVPKNEYTKDGVHELVNGNISVSNKDTHKKAVVVSKPDIDAARNSLNKAGLPGNAYSDGDIAQLIVKANRQSLDVVTVAKGSTK